MTFELLSQLTTVAFYAAVVLYPISAFFAGTRMKVWKLGVIAGLGGMIFFAMATVGAITVQDNWVMDRLNCHETTIDCAEILPNERQKMERILNDKGRDMAYIFFVLFSIPYGLLVSVLIVISRLIQNKVFR
ncbi:MAG: hypothetical protein ABJ056_10450 [Halioglobus sp.]